MVKQEDMNDSFISSVAAKKIAHILQPFISSSAGRHAQRPRLRSRYIKFEVWRWESGALWKVMAHFWMHAAAILRVDAHQSGASCPLATLFSVGK